MEIRNPFVCLIPILTFHRYELSEISELSDMMYSQQEYDMVRRQTMQIEAEKRALLRWALIGASALMIGSLFLTAWMFRRYSLAEDLIRTADEKRRLRGKPVATGQPRTRREESPSGEERRRGRQTERHDRHDRA